VPRIDPQFDRNVFINCPFDAAYAPIFEAVVFAVYDAGFYARSPSNGSTPARSVSRRSSR